MIAEWRTTSGTGLVDIYLWLEDSVGEKVIYPNTTSAKKWHGMGAYPADAPNKQWVEQEIRTNLQRGTTYEVCLSVRPEGSGDGPAIQSPGVKGVQKAFEY